MSASVVSGVDASPVFEPSEHILDFVAAPVEHFVEGGRILPVGSRWNAGGDATLDQSLTEPVCVIPPISQQRLGPGKRIDHERSAPIVAHLTFAEQQDDRASFAVTDGMELGVQAPFCAPDTSGNSPFFRRLAAVRCALR